MFPSGVSFAMGQGTTLIIVNFGGTPGTGNIRVRAQNSCASSAYLTKVVTINNCPRLSGETLDGLQLHPNPFHTSAVLTLLEQTDLATSKIFIYNILGKQIRAIFILQQYDVEIEKGDLPQGLYFIKLISGNNENGVVKMVVE